MAQPKTKAKNKKDFYWTDKGRGYGVISVDEVTFNPQNPRVHVQAQSTALVGILDDVGIVKDVIVNLREGDEWPEELRKKPVLVDGHLRVKDAAANGQKTWPAKFVELTPREEAIVLASLDYVGTLAQIDSKQLETLLHNVESGNSAVQGLMAQMAESAGLLESLKKEDSDAQADNDSISYKEQFGVIVVCSDEAEQEEVFNKLKEQGYTCKVVTV